MDARETQFITVGKGATKREIAYLSAPAAAPGAPGIMWFIGLKSDMVSTKAEALATFAARHGLGCTRFDYSGHGRSGGRFEEATLSDWLEEGEAIFTRVTQGPQVLVGSSTGAHVALLLLRHLMQTNPREAERIAGLVLVAPAWDLTELMWNEIPEDGRRQIAETGQWMRPSPYEGGGYPITRRFIEDGRRHSFEGCGFDPGRPIAVLQGGQDQDVPIAHALRLKDVLGGGWVSFTIVPDGEHRLSRPEDLMLLEQLVARQLALAGHSFQGLQI